MCLEIYELDLGKFLSVPGLAQQAAKKRTKVKLDLLTDVTNNKYMKDYDEKKELSYIQYWVYNLYGQTMSQKLQVNSFEWIKDTSQF